MFGWSPKVAPENVVLIGLRDIDATEKANIRRAGITEVYTMRDIDERGLRTVMEEAVRAAARDTAGYHISLDMDWIDPEDAPGVGTPVRGGATYREAHLAMEIIADDGRMLSFELGRSKPGDRRAQPHRGPGGRTDLLRVRKKDSVGDMHVQAALFLKPDFHTNRDLVHLCAAKWHLRQHLFDFVAGVGALQQHKAKGEQRHPAVDSADADSVHIFANG